MLVKTGNAEILDVVNHEETQDDDKRSDALTAALNNAKKRIETKTTDSKASQTTEN
jgi:hypothetical protein